MRPAASGGRIAMRSLHPIEGGRKEYRGADGPMTEARQ
jgi:hypothetical protein